MLQVPEKDQFVRQGRMGDDGGATADARHVPPPHRSSFPKAKPTLGMRRVVWFALVRLVFLPALYTWWSQQTSPSCARFLLALWTMQLANMVLYFTSPATPSVDVTLVTGIRRPRSECDGGSAGASGESGATSSQSKPPSAKPSKFRRRQSRTDVPDTGLRKRKKELIKENLIKTMEPIMKKTLMKAKDSDDEDYMVWKKPDVSTPIVTFTPPPDDSVQPSFTYKNILTKKRLESFNVLGHNHNVNLARAMFAEGDDGFESLNGYNSNGSDAEHRKEPLSSPPLVYEPSDTKPVAEKPAMDPSIKQVPSHVLRNVARLKREDDEKSIGHESDGSVPTSGPGEGKRIGVRFKKSWVPETVPRETSDEEYVAAKKKSKVEIRELPEFVVRRRMFGIGAIHRSAIAPYHVGLGWANY
ncbi:hypothetical protein MSG28_004137 [Choristoneura fumiferana]|uniref:Uncharacterized protein n=1 Tax=Choristoneura fumiferana TaxID=7141 RepID=A0ACC0KIR2_CHOFU|nr:hypothetical protein MSG28_004137 [Choristoneura fumiferana]